MLKIGSHVSMSGKEMMLGSVKEALSYGSTTFMFYTGAPQNTARKPIDQLRIDEAKALMAENNINIDDVVVHAPYIINLANTIKPETFENRKLHDVKLLVFQNWFYIQEHMSKLATKLDFNRL